MNPNNLSTREKLEAWREYVATDPNALLSPENPKDYPTIKDFHRERGIPCCERCGEVIGQGGQLRLDFKPPHPWWIYSVIVPCPKCNGGGK